MGRRGTHRSAQKGWTDQVLWAPHSVLQTVWGKCQFFIVRLFLGQRILPEDLRLLSAQPRIPGKQHQTQGFYYMTCGWRGQGRHSCHRLCDVGCDIHSVVCWERQDCSCHIPQEGLIKGDTEG